MTRPNPAFLKQHAPLLVYTGIALVIMAPLFKPGFLFLLDMVWPPQIHLAAYLMRGFMPSLVWIGLFKALSFLIPLAVIQKLVLTFILISIGYSGYALAKTVLPKSWATVSGLIYLLNPYVYERFLAGQYFVLAGYAFFPFVLVTFQKLFTAPSPKSFTTFIILAALYPLISPHWAYLTLFILPLYGAVYWFITKRSLTLPNSKRAFIFPIFLFFAIVLFVVISLLRAKSGYNNFTLSDFQAFVTSSDPKWGSFFNVLSLYGFWSVDYLLPKDYFNYWWILTFILLLFSGLGLYAFIRQKQPLGILLGVIFIPTLLVAVGYAHPFTHKLINILYFIPGFKGLRDTAKVIGLLALCYAILVPKGGLFVTEYILPKARISEIVMLAFLTIIPLLATNSIFNGFNGQVIPSDYPVSWYEADRQLAHDASVKQVLFLPWFGYSRYPFAKDHLIANPAQAFFTPPVVTTKLTDNLHLDRNLSPLDIMIIRWADEHSVQNEDFDYFKQHQISHIIVAKATKGTENYSFLRQSKRLSILYESPVLVVYAIN